MNESCIRMCEILFRIFYIIYFTFIVNNVEIDLIFQSYVKLWYVEPSKNYIPCSKMLNYYPFKLQGVIRMFFQDCIYFFYIYQIADIYYDDYFQFVCLFLFFDVDRLILLFLSLSHIHSNIFITNRQLARFVNGFYLNNDSFSNLITVISSQSNSALSETKDAYYLKEFTKYLKGSTYFNSMIEEIKFKLATTVLNPTIYNNIKIRLEYFYHYPDSINKPSPPENCKNKILRELFTNDPPPFLYDYHVAVPDNKLFDEMIYNLRQGHGYGARASSRVSSNPNVIKSLLFNKKSMKSNQNSLYNSCHTESPKDDLLNSSYKRTINGNNLTNVHNSSRKNVFLSPSASPVTGMSFKRTIPVIKKNN